MILNELYFKNQLEMYKMVKKFPIGNPYQRGDQMFIMFTRQSPYSDTLFTLHWIKYRNQLHITHREMLYYR